MNEPTCAMCTKGLTEMTDQLLSRHREDLCHIRNITDDLIDALPERYRSFEDFETFARLMRLDLSNYAPSTVSALKAMVTKSGGGVVITRYDVDGAVLPPYARFDKEVTTGKGKRTHYIYRPKYGVKHIDIHPMQPKHKRTHRWNGFTELVDVYLALEGCFKGDAILSTGHEVCSSTSVTTWECNDLKGLLPLLRSARTVYVVPDSDYFVSDKARSFHLPEGFFNPAVLFFTRRAAQWLATRGVTSKIAFPWTIETKDFIVSKLGVDDYLWRGYALEDLTIEEPFADALYLRPSLNLTKDENRVFDWLLYHHGNRGAFMPSDIARDLGISRKTVYRAYMNFQEHGIMRVWQSKPIAIEGGGHKSGPHVFVQYELVSGYRDFVDKTRVPIPVQRARIQNLPVPSVA